MIMLIVGIVVGLLLLSLLYRILIASESKRFEEMTPEERFKYQNEMRKRQL